MAKREKRYLFIGLNEQQEKVKGDLMARDSLEAIRILKIEMGVKTLLEVKEQRRIAIALGNLASSKDKVSANKDEERHIKIIPRKVKEQRRIAIALGNLASSKDKVSANKDEERHIKIIPRKVKTPKQPGKEKAQNSILTQIKKLKHVNIGKKTVMIDQEELNQAVTIATESIFKSLGNAQKNQQNIINTNSPVQERVVYVQAGAQSLGAYTQIRDNSSGGLGGDLKDKLESNGDGTKIKMDWGVIDKTKPKAKLKIKLKELVLLSHKMAILLGAGILLLDALYIVKGSFKKKHILETIQNLITKVQSGYSLSEAMKEYPNIFDEFYIAVVSVGESVGSLASSFADLSKLYKTRLGVKKKAKAASIYPMVTFSMLALMLVGASIFFLPQFKELFESSGIELPGITKAVFAFSDAMPAIIIATIILLIIGSLLYRNIPIINKYINIGKDFVMANVPVAKKFTQILSLYNFSSTMQIMLKNGISLIDSLDLSTSVVQNLIYKVQIGSLKGCVIDGMSFAESTSYLDRLDTFTISMIRIGEESGNLGAAFQNINEYQQEQLKEFTDMLSEAMQPVMLILLAVVVMPIIVAIYLPLMQMSSGSGLGM